MNANTSRTDTRQGSQAMTTQTTDRHGRRDATQAQVKGRKARRTWRKRIAAVLSLLAGLTGVTASQDADASLHPFSHQIKDQTTTGRFNFDINNGPNMGWVDLERSSISFPNEDILHDVQQQWYWFRQGNTGAATQLGTGDLPLVGGSVQSFDTDFDGDHDVIRADFQGTGSFNNLFVRVTYSLIGSVQFGAKADMSRAIQVLNMGNTTMNNLNVFEYGDFTLTFAHNDAVEASNYPDFAKWDNETGNSITFYDFEIEDANVMASAMQNIVLPDPTNYELGPAASLLNRLNTDSPISLSNNFNGGQPFSTEGQDLAYILQWNRNLGARRSFTIVEDTLIIPEPATLLIVAGAGGLILMRRRPRRGEVIEEIAAAEPSDLTEILAMPGESQRAA